MKPQDFCYWLQGLFEIGQPTQLTDQQLKIIKEHLALALNRPPSTISGLQPLQTLQTCSLGIVPDIKTFGT